MKQRERMLQGLDEDIRGHIEIAIAVEVMPSARNFR